MKFRAYRTCPEWRDPLRFRSGDVIAFHRTPHWWDPRTWFAWRIQRTTGSPWNHIGLLAWEHQQWHVIEALFRGGVVVTPLRCYYNVPGQTWIVRGRQNLQPLERRKIVEWALSQVGKPYDWQKILMIRFLQFVLRNRREVLDRIRFDEDDDMLICSELVKRAYARVGIDLGGDLVSPGGIVRALAG